MSSSNRQRTTASGRSATIFPKGRDTARDAFAQCSGVARAQTPNPPEFDCDPQLVRELRYPRVTNLHHQPVIIIQGEPTIMRLVRYTTPSFQSFTPAFGFQR